MEEDLDLLMDMTKESMEDTIEHLQKELLKIRTGKASPAMLGGIMVSYYGAPTPLQQVSNISASDARTLTIQPWEKSMLGPIEKGIFEANLGITPMNDGEVVRISIPPLTTERRKDLSKQVKAHGEDAKVSLRNVRREAMEAIKKEVKNGYPEDAGKRLEDQVEDLIKSYSVRVDKIVEVKEKDIMTV